MKMIDKVIVKYVRNKVDLVAFITVIQRFGIKI